MIKEFFQSIFKTGSKSVGTGFPGYRRDAAKRTGSMANWIPRRLFSKDQETLDRDMIVSRAINLINDDPHAAGIVETFATTIIGAGLQPNPALNSKVLGLPREQIKKIEAQQKAIYKAWAQNPDVAGRMTDGEIQHLKTRCLFGMGESLEILLMQPSPMRPYSLASQVINPARLKTPTDKRKDENIRDGIEISKWGEPVAYWIKKVGETGQYMTDNSKNFMRIPAKKGHRYIVLHDFISKDPEQFRGYPILAPAMRYFRDFSDLLSAELTSNVITAALSLFVESENPGVVADAVSNTEDFDEDDRMQEFSPGQVWYGSAGEKPHLLSAARPGVTFEPFTKLIKKTIAVSTGIPYPVLFKDVDGVSFAGFRSAMLEAWRVYEYHRKRIGQKDCQKKYTMLMEEAWLRDELDITDFYEKKHQYCNTEWCGAPKGDIEPWKQIKANIEKFNARVKPLERIIIEDGGAGFLEVAEQIEEELEIMKEKNIMLAGEKNSESESKKEESNGEDVSEIDEIKGKLDAYGVGVRAGGLTPQQDDEAAFREMLELPKNTNFVDTAWKEDEGFRRPITLSSGQLDAKSEDNDESKEDKDSEKAEDGEKDA